MATKNGDHITSRGMLAWANRVEAQRAQAAVLKTLTESKQFDKIKISKKAKDNNHESSSKPDHTVRACADTIGESTS